MTRAGRARTVVDAPLRHARVAVGICFVLNAVFFANLAPRLPEVRDGLGLSNAALGTALAAAPVGALLLGPLAALLITRLGSARVASAGLVLLGFGWAAVAVAPAWWALALAFAAVGALDTIVDVAQNAHGLRVQRGYGRSILNALHGFWSLGAVVGGLMGSAAAGLDVPLAWHLGGSAVLFGAVALLLGRWLLPGPDDEPTTPAVPAPDLPVARGAGRRAATRSLLALGLLAAAAVLVEDAAASWSAIWLRDDLGTSAALAGAGFVACQLAMTVGRFTGDRVVDRFGRDVVSRVGGLLVAAGMGLMLVAPAVPTTLAGFALAGLGAATLVPSAYAAADEVPGLPPGVGLTTVNWLLRAGFLVTPPVIGAIADVAGLRVGFLLVVAGGAVVVLLSGHLRRPAVPSLPPSSGG